MTQLIIYPDLGQVIQKRSPGSNKSVFVPSTIDTASIIALSSEENVLSTSIIPTNREKIGQNVSLYIVHKGDKRYTGTLVVMDDNIVTLWTGKNIISIREYDTIQQNLEYIEHQTVELTDEAVQLSYLFTGISWKCVGTGLISDDKLQLTLSAMVSVKPEPALPMRFDSIKFVSGTLSQPSPNANTRSTLMAMKTSPSRVEDNIVWDYEYEVSYQKLDKTFKLENYTFDSSKFYSHYIGTDTTQFGYRFVPKKALPACSITVYAYDNNMVGNYLGTVALNATTADKEAQLILRDTTKISSQSRVEHSERIEEKEGVKTTVYSDIITLTVTNQLNRNIRLVCSFWIGDREVTNVSRQVLSWENGMLKWEFTISPGGPFTESWNITSLGRMMSV